MLVFTTNIILKLFDCVIIYFMYITFYRKKTTISTKAVCGLVMWSVIMAGLGEYLNNMLYTVVYYSSVYYAVHYYCSKEYVKKWHETLTLYATMLFELYLIQTVIGLLLQISNVQLEAYLLFILAQALTLIAAIGIYFIFKNVYKIYHTMESVAVLRMVVFILTVVIYGYMYSQNKDMSNNQETIRFSVMLLISAAVIIHAVVLAIEDDKKVKFYQECVPSIHLYINEIREVQHSYANFMSYTISKLKTMEGDPRAEAIIRDLVQQYKLTDIDDLNKSLLKTNSEAIASFIYNKVKHVQENGVTVHTDIDFKREHQTIPEFILAEAIGIMLDNAIEACEDETDCHIYFKLIVDLDKVHIEMINKSKYLSQREILDIFEKGYSSKQKKPVHFQFREHGYGMYRLRKIKELYDGKISVENITFKNENYISFVVDF